MKKNKFNLIIPFRNDYLAYNPMTNALCKIDRKVLAFLEGKEISLQAEVIEELIKGLFLVPDSFNELSYIDHLFYSQKYGVKRIGFTIIPTLFCNLRCIYCYESTTNLNISMDASTIERTIIFIRKRIEEFHPAFLDITWYGGEPLLEIDTIGKISHVIQNECKQRNINYTSSLITNGTLLSKCNKDFLSSCKIRSIQITVDGPQEIHNLRRPLKNGNGTYAIIMRNIFDILTREPTIRINLRINIDKDNEKHVPVLLKELSSSVKNWDRLGINFGQVTSASTSLCKSQIDVLFTTSEFAHYYLKIIEEMKRLNLPLPRLYPSFNGCLWKSFTNWMIGPQGELYGCWEDVGDNDKIVGDISTGVDLKRKRAWEWIFSSWRATDMCSSCPIVPICLGGCPRRWETAFNNLEGGCMYLRYIFNQILLLHAEMKETKLADITN